MPLEMLGARLETYINKATMDIIRLCLWKLPVELFYHIIGKIQSSYNERLEWWQAANNCCENKYECGHGSVKHDSRIEGLMARIGQRCYRTDFHKRKQVCVAADLRRITEC